eukprot:9729_1
MATILGRSCKYISLQSTRLISKQLLYSSSYTISNFKHINSRQNQLQSSSVFQHSLRHRHQDEIFANKVKSSCKQALIEGGLIDNCTVLAGGFGICGIPMTLIQTIKELKTKDLTVVSNDFGTNEWGLGVLLDNLQIKRVIGSYMAENKNVGSMYTDGKIELELMPQGTLAEKLRAGGAGIPAFYTPAGVDTIIEAGQHIIRYNDEGYPMITSGPKESRIFEGKKFILEKAIKGHIGLVKAWKGDKFGNLQFRKTAENFNKPVAMASDYTIAEVEEIVEIGTLKPEEIHVSGVYVQAIVQSTVPSKLHYTVYHNGHNKKQKTVTSVRELSREKICKRGAMELTDGIVVNLGIGLPVMTADYVPSHWRLWMHSENGVLGLGKYPYPGEEDPDCINSGKQSATLVAGAAMFDSSEAFAMIRGGHLNMKMLGAMEINKYGDLANWIIPGQGKNVKGMGGGMDLVANDSYCVVLTHHCTSKGEPKIVEHCSYPITGKNCVNKIITEYAVFDVDKMRGLNLIEIDDVNIDIEELRKITGCEFTVDKHLKSYQQIDDNIKEQ